MGKRGMGYKLYTRVSEDMGERCHLEELSTEDRLLSKWISKNGALNGITQVRKLQGLSFTKQ